MDWRWDHLNTAWSAPVTLKTLETRSFCLINDVDDDNDDDDDNDKEDEDDDNDDDDDNDIWCMIMIKLM